MYFVYIDPIFMLYFLLLMDGIQKLLMHCIKHVLIQFQEVLER